MELKSIGCMLNIWTARVMSVSNSVHALRVSDVDVNIDAKEIVGGGQSAELTVTKR